LSLSDFYLLSDPDVPTLHGSPTDVQQTSATLDWNTGDTAVIDSSTLYYADTSTAISEWQTTEIVDKLTGLTPGDTYLFYLCVQSFDKTACSTNNSVTTREYHSLPI